MCKGPEVGHWSKWELKGWAELTQGQRWGQKVWNGCPLLGLWRGPQVLVQTQKVGLIAPFKVYDKSKGFKTDSDPKFSTLPVWNAQNRATCRKFQNPRLSG